MWDILIPLLPEIMLLKLEAIFLSSDNTRIDRLAWRGTSNGWFSVKLAYKLTIEDSVSEPAALWNFLWRLCLPQRVKMFVWIVLKEKIITNHERLKRHFTMDAFYICCFLYQLRNGSRMVIRLQHSLILIDLPLLSYGM